MGRLKGFGVANQGFHPRARGTLSSFSGAKHNNRGYWNPSNPEMTSHYFVPSFSIRRHLDSSEEIYWDEKSKQIGSILGRHFEVMPTTDVTIKTIEQKALINKIRDTGERPTAPEMRDVVFNLRDNLKNALTDAPEPLEIGIGRLAVFGRNRNKLGFTLEGWRGWRGRYDDHEHMGQMTSLGALLVESQVAIGTIATAFPEMRLAVSDIATSPHITIARTNDTIREHELRRIQGAVNELAVDTLYFGDPIINYKLGPAEESQSIPIRHAWASLADVDYGIGNHQDALDNDSSAFDELDVLQTLYG